jgi:uncharacterized protein (DUF433 family)
MDRITTDPRVRWGTPCLRDTGTSVAHVVTLRQAGSSIDTILDACPELTVDDIDCALEWHATHGDDFLGPRPPVPGDRHPWIAVDPTMQGGYPTIVGTRVTVDAILGLWEEGMTVEDILEELPGVCADAIADAIAYDAELGLH